MIEYGGFFNPDAVAIAEFIPMVGGIPPDEAGLRQQFAAAVGDPVGNPLSIHAVALNLMQQLDLDQNTIVQLTTQLGAGGGLTELFVRIDGNWKDISFDIEGDLVPHLNQNTVFKIEITVDRAWNLIGGIVQTLAHEICAHAIPYKRIITEYRENAHAANAAENFQQKLQNLSNNEQHRDLLLQNGNNINNNYTNIRENFEANSNNYHHTEAYGNPRIQGSFRYHESRDLSNYQGQMQDYYHIEIPTWW